MNKTIKNRSFQGRNIPQQKGLSYPKTGFSFYETVSKKIQWIYLILGFVAITSVVYALSFLINDKIDWKILLFLNPDSTMPATDALMILITDFSIAGFGTVFVFWEIGYRISKHAQEGGKKAERFLKIVGLIFALVAGSAYFWAGYAHAGVFFPFALFLYMAFRFIASTLTHYNREELDRINRLFWMTLMATMLTELAAEGIIKDLVARARPLSHIYAFCNGGIRKVADEIVTGGYSYVPGHSSVFFAMTTPLMFFVSKRAVKGALFSWAAIHAFTRVYLGAHFFYDSLIGAALGLSMAILVTKTFGVQKKKGKGNNTGNTG
jgi:membrane-associated phospholipid phosphatase